LEDNPGQPVDISGQVHEGEQMSVTDVRRSPISTQMLVQFGTARGMGLSQCLYGTGIDSRVWSDPSTEILFSQELQLIRNLLGALGPVPGLGLDAGSAYRLSSQGVWGFALLSSTTFRNAAEVAVRYSDLSHALTRIRLERRDLDLLLILDGGELPADVRQFVVERDFAVWANAARELRPGGFPAAVAQFRFSRPSYDWRFDKLSGARAEFDAPITAVLLDAEQLDAPLPQANPLMARVCEEQCRQMLAKRRVRAGVAGQVRDRLARSPTAKLSLDAIADELHMATRTLRRRLEQEGTSFRDLLDEARQAMAEELLLISDMKLDEIASRLSYAEPAAFIHAFKRWKGMSPTAYRQLRDTPAAPREIRGR
jgi:AraC-like DNA-binding protein